MTAITLGGALRAARARIDAVDARVLLQHATGLTHAQLISHDDRELAPAQADAFAALVERRTAGEPVAYLIGWREFFGRRFAVAPGVLIPRPDTELLVELALSRLRGLRAPHILDLGCGSGILAITLALELPGAAVVGVDASADALDMSRLNAAALRAQVRFVESDWYARLPAHDGAKFDLIVANPPYIAPDDPHLAQGDLRFEPRAALVGGGAGGEDDIAAIAMGAPAHLQAGGWLMVEHGWTQAQRVRALFVAAGFADVGTACDLAGRERACVGRLAA